MNAFGSVTVLLVIGFCSLTIREPDLLDEIGPTQGPDVPHSMELFASNRDDLDEDEEGVQDPVTEDFREAQQLTAASRWDEGVVAWNAFLEEYPLADRVREARFWLGYCQVRSDDFEDAVETLSPFAGLLSEDVWADDALLQLGNAYATLQQYDLARAAWERLVDRYPDSVWTREALFRTIDLYFSVARDYETCFDYCAQYVDGYPRGPEANLVRFWGAYCLNALGEFDEGSAWIRALFDLTDPLCAAQDQLLDAQVLLIEGRDEEAIDQIDTLTETYPDLPGDDRRELLIQATYLLREHGQSRDAAELLEQELTRLDDLEDDEIQYVLGELSICLGDVEDLEVVDWFQTLLHERGSKLPWRVRAKIREILLIRWYDNQDESVLTWVREAIDREPVEPGRFDTLAMAARLLSNRERLDEARALLDHAETIVSRPDLRLVLEELRDDFGLDEELDPSFVDEP